jgi:hypothetical protein
MGCLRVRVGLGRRQKAASGRAAPVMSARASPRGPTAEGSRHRRPAAPACRPPSSRDLPSEPWPPSRISSDPEDSQVLPLGLRGPEWLRAGMRLQAGVRALRRDRSRPSLRSRSEVLGSEQRWRGRPNASVRRKSSKLGSFWILRRAHPQADRACRGSAVVRSRLLRRSPCSSPSLLPGPLD